MRDEVLRNLSDLVGRPEGTLTLCTGWEQSTAAQHTANRQQPWAKPAILWSNGVDGVLLSHFTASAMFLTVEGYH
jgi:hypothetical protein